MDNNATKQPTDEDALRTEFESLASDSYKFKRSRKGTYVNSSVARDWKWFKLGAQRAPAAPELTVWEGAMPESNGKSNFTAVLHRKDSKGLDLFTDGFQFERSEYPDRVRYEADFMRWLIGEREVKPELWDKCYDMDKHSGYAAHAARPVAATPDTVKPYAGMLGKLLSRIHRDGGHRQHEIGTEAAVEEADRIVATLYATTSTTAVGAPDLELVIARLEQIAGNFAEDYRESAAEALACARALRIYCNDKAVIRLTPAEIQSGSDRVRWAEGLIRQLPETHDGRNSWLLNYSAVWVKTEGK